MIQTKIKKYNESDLIYDSRHSFHEHNNFKKCDLLSFDLKCNTLISFY